MLWQFSISRQLAIGIENSLSIHTALHANSAPSFKPSHIGSNYTQHAIQPNYGIILSQKRQTIHPTPFNLGLVRPIANSTTHPFISNTSAKIQTKTYFPIKGELHVYSREDNCEYTNGRAHEKPKPNLLGNNCRTFGEQANSLSHDFISSSSSSSPLHHHQKPGNLNDAAANAFGKQEKFILIRPGI